jgi:hypothetical protein
MPDLFDEIFSLSPHVRYVALVQREQEPTLREIIRYGNFFQILHALPAGHLSVAVEPHGEPLRVVEALQPILARLRIVGSSERMIPNA